MIAFTRTLSVAVTCWLFVACGPSGGAEPAPSEPPPPPSEPPPTTQPAAEPPAPAMPPMPAAPEGASVRFVSPTDGATVSGPLVDGKVEVAVTMGAEGVRIEPAGAVAEGAGHHHILIDTEPEAQGEVVPADDQHVHFGKAQTEAKLQLTPGPHTLTLQLADGLHRSYGPVLSARIAITVQGAEGAAAPAKTAE